MVPRVTRTGRSAQAGLRGRCITPTETTCWVAGFLGALGASRLCPGALDRGFRPRSKRTFCSSRRDLAIGAVGTPAFQDRPQRPRARDTLRNEHIWYTELCNYCVCAVLAVPSPLDRVCPPRSKRTFCTSRRALAIISVVGTPRTGRSAQAGVRGCCITPTETACWVAGFTGLWGRSGGAKSVRSSLHPHVLTNFLMISTSSSDWCGRTPHVLISASAPSRARHPARARRSYVYGSPTARLARFRWGQVLQIEVSDPGPSELFNDIDEL